MARRTRIVGWRWRFKDGGFKHIAQKAEHISKGSVLVSRIYLRMLCTITYLTRWKEKGTIRFIPELVHNLASALALRAPLLLLLTCSHEVNRDRTNWRACRSGPRVYVGCSAEWSLQELSCHVLVHEGMKDATSSNLLDPALDTASPSVWFIRSADGRSTTREWGCLQLHEDATRNVPWALTSNLPAHHETAHLTRQTCGTGTQRTVHGRRTSGWGRVVEDGGSLWQENIVGHNTNVDWAVHER